MNAILAVLLSGLVAGALAAGTIVVTHGRSDPLDPQTEIRWLVRRLEHRPRAMAWVRRRLDRTTATGFMLTAIFLVVLITAILVGALFQMFTRNALVARWDTSVARWGAEHVGDDNRTVLVRITDLGSSMVVLVVVAVVVGVELVKRKWASAAFVTLVVAGQFAINNLLKIIVARPRPDIARLVGVSGHSFPSGHTVAATATWAAVALVVSRSAPRRGRAVAAGLAAAIAAAVGATRALLGAHWLTDVLAGLAVGWGWFTLVAVLFGGRRQRAAVPLEVAAHAPLPVSPHHDDPQMHVETSSTQLAERHGRADRGGHRPIKPVAVAMARSLALFVVVGAAIGLLISRGLDHTGFIGGDRSINEWFVDHRTPRLDDMTHVLSVLGNTETIIALGATAVLLMRARWHRWDEPLVLIVGLSLEVLSFLVLGNIVGRDRPDVDRLDPAPPTSSFPSGHTAAATVLYVGLAWIVLAHVHRRPLRYLIGLLGVALPTTVAVARVYRGMHHLTDVVAGAVLGIACLVVALRIAMPGPDRPHGVIPSAPDVETPQSPSPAATEPVHSSRRSFLREERRDDFAVIRQVTT